MMKVRRRPGNLRGTGNRLHLRQSTEKKRRSPRRRRAAAAAAGKHLEIPVVDLQQIQRCVVLMGRDAADKVDTTDDFRKVKFIAWYPEKGEAALISSTQLLMPPLYRPVDSCGGFVCGIHVDCINESAEWKLRVAVSNPASNYQVKLPVLDLTRLPVAKTCPEREFNTGRFQVRMTPPLHGGELFCVHVTTSCNGEHTVHSFNTGCWRWESSTPFSGKPIVRHLVGDVLFRQRNVRSYDVGRRKWTAIAGPEDGKPWDADFPVLERFSGSTYYRMFPFRYGKKIMAACSLSRCEFVLLELSDDDEEQRWKVVVAAKPKDFPSCGSVEHSFSELSFDWPVVSGDLLVLSADGFCRPVAFNLRNHIWMEVPPVLADSNWFLYAAFVYEPRQQL